MRCFHFLLLSSIFSPILAAVTLIVNSPTAEAGSPVNVDWTREESDPGHFDIRFILDGEDIGVVAGSVYVEEDVLEGTTKVTFPSEGSFALVAMGPGKATLGGSDEIEVRSTLDQPASSIPTIPRPQSPVTTITTGWTPPTTTANPDTSLFSSKSSKIPAVIIGSTIAAIALVLVILLVVFLYMRRNESSLGDKAQRRVTFHRDLMVQAQPPSERTPVGNGNGNGDVEGGLQGQGPHLTRPVSPLAFPHSAALPFPTSPNRPVSTYTPVHGAPTDRQILLSKRVRQLEEMMHEIRFKPGMSRVLEQLRMQVSWLRAQRNSPWALGETDETPLHYDLYLGGR